MPWLERCIERLPRGMAKERVIHVLVFLSSVGMIQNGDFVSFQKLTEVERDLPVTQKHMQQLGILSQLVLIYSPCFFCFHEDIPQKVVVPVTPPGKPAQPRPPTEEAASEYILFSGCPIECTWFGSTRANRRRDMVLHSQLYGLGLGNIYIYTKVHPPPKCTLFPVVLESLIYI